MHNNLNINKTTLTEKDLDKSSFDKYIKLDHVILGKEGSCDEYQFITECNCLENVIKLLKMLMCGAISSEKIYTNKSNLNLWGHRRKHTFEMQGTELYP